MLTRLWRWLNAKRWHVLRQGGGEPDRAVCAHRSQAIAELHAHLLQTGHHKHVVPPIESGVFYTAFRAGHALQQLRAERVKAREAEAQS